MSVSKYGLVVLTAALVFLLPMQVCAEMMEEDNATSEGVEFEGLLSKVAVINNSMGISAEDVLGWDYIYRDDGTCYKYYAAQPPLIGMTQPVQIACPLGIQVFDSYQVDFKEAIDIIHSMDCGDSFVAMSLSWPLTPDSTEPLWHVKMSIGNDIVIGANSGEANCHSI